MHWMFQLFYFSSCFNFFNPDFFFKVVGGKWARPEDLIAAVRRIGAQLVKKKKIDIIHAFFSNWIRDMKTECTSSKDRSFTPLLFGANFDLHNKKNISTLCRKQRIGTRLRWATLCATFC